MVTSVHVEGGAVAVCATEGRDGRVGMRGTVPNRCQFLTEWWTAHNVVVRSSAQWTGAWEGLVVVMAFIIDQMINVMVGSTVQSSPWADCERDRLCLRFHSEAQSLQLVQEERGGNLTRTGPCWSWRPPQQRTGP
jgi:hypothetical protein